MKVRQTDFVWSYLAQVFKFASGIFVLPLILRLLTSEEIGFNYIMLSVTGLVNLLDFGFSKQFGRNFSYVFGGTQILKTKGVLITKAEGSINYTLLKDLIQTAKMVYGLMALLSFVLLSTLGTIYVYKITKGFTLIENSISIWLLFVISVSLNVFFKYYNSMVRGKGQIAELNKIQVLGRVIQLLFNVSLLLLGFGLIGLAIGNFIYPFFTRFLLYRTFHDPVTNSGLSEVEGSKERMKQLFLTIWPTTRKIGLVFIGSYLIGKMSVFISGLYLPLKEVASYGIMVQLFGYIVTLSSVVFNVFQPRISALRVKGNDELILESFTLSMGLFYVSFFVASFLLITFGSNLLVLLGSNISLPEISLLVIYAVILLLEHNHSLFSSLIVTKNEVPFVKAALLSGFCAFIGTFVFLEWTSFNEVLILVIVPGIVQLLYNNWRWPFYVFKEFDITIFDYFIIMRRVLFDFLIAQMPKRLQG